MSSDVAEMTRPVSSVPDGWQSSTLGEALARAEGGGTPPRDVDAYWNGDIPWASVKDIVKGNGSIPEETITAAGLANSTSRIIAAGTNIFAARMGVGAVTRYPMDVAINQDLMALTPTKGLDPDYLYHWLRSKKAAFAAVATGTTVKGIRKDLLLSFPLSLPPLDEQRRIAEVLRSVDEAIAANDALLNGIRAAKQASMEAVLCGGFDEVRLETLLAETRYPMRSGPFGSALLKSELHPEGIPFLGIDNVHVERFVPIYRRFVSEEKYWELARYTVYPGDVMVTIMGTVGRCCVVPPDLGTAISSKHVWTLTIDQDRYSPALLAWQINHSPPVLEQLQGSAQGGIMSAISSSTLRDLLVPVPSPAEVRQIEEVLLSFNEQIGALETEQAQANFLKAALSNDLLSGHVRVPVVVGTPTNVVPSAFKRAVFAAEIVHQLYNDNRFGSVKHEKIVHLCELHLDLHSDLDRHAYKRAAGPYDPVARRSVEQIFRQQKWFGTAKPDGKRVVYSPLDEAGGHQTYYDRYFGEKKAAIQSIIDLLRPLDTERCAIIATLYAVWNDFLIDGHPPTDAEIVASVLNDWHPSKRQIAESRWRSALPWMRQHHLVPNGRGEKTRVAKG